MLYGNKMASLFSVYWGILKDAQEYMIYGKDAI